MRRLRTPELMDDPAVNTQDHAHALRTLNRINRWLGIDRGLARRVRRISSAAQTLTILDLGAGGGGFLGTFSPNGDRRVVRIGIDRSEFALRCARSWHSRAIQCVAADARAIPLASDSVDVVTCSLFLHHFDFSDAACILREASRVARRGIVIGDLSRSWTAWVATWLTTRIVSRSRLFHVDGPRSVRAAFCAHELERLAGQAGLRNARVSRRPPFRLVLTWTKGGIPA